MEQLYTKYDLSNKFRISVSTIDNHMRDNKIDYLKIGKSVRFTEQSVSNYLRQFNKKKYTAKKIDDIGISGLVNGLQHRTTE